MRRVDRGKSYGARHTHHEWLETDAIPYCAECPAAHADAMAAVGRCRPSRASLDAMPPDWPPRRLLYRRAALPGGTSPVTETLDAVRVPRFAFEGTARVRRCALRRSAGTGGDVAAFVELEGVASPVAVDFFAPGFRSALWTAEGYVRLPQMLPLRFSHVDLDCHGSVAGVPLERAALSDFALQPIDGPHLRLTFAGVLHGPAAGISTLAAALDQHVPVSLRQREGLFATDEE